MKKKPLEDGEITARSIGSLELEGFKLRLADNSPDSKDDAHKKDRKKRPIQ